MTTVAQLTIIMSNGHLLTKTNYGLFCIPSQANNNHMNNNEKNKNIYCI